MPEEETMITMDDFIPGQSSYQAEAIQKDVKAKVQFFRASDRDRSGAYTLHTSYDKLAEFGRLGRHQEKRAQALQTRLLEKVKTELEVWGWQLVETTQSGREYWMHHGMLTPELQAQLEKVAVRIWRGSYEWLERDKVAPVERPEWLYQIPTSNWIELESDLEIGLNPHTKMLHVHRKSPERVPSEEVHQEVRSRIVSIVGNEHAKLREDQEPAYQRKISTRLIRFKCDACKQWVTQQRFPGRKPKYCSETCETEGKREKTRARVQKHREKHRS